MVLVVITAVATAATTPAQVRGDGVAWGLKGWGEVRGLEAPACPRTRKRGNSVPHAGSEGHLHFAVFIPDDGLVRAYQRRVAVAASRHRLRSPGTLRCLLGLCAPAYTDVCTRGAGGKEKVDCALDVPSVALKHGLGSFRIFGAGHSEKGLDLAATVLDVHSPRARALQDRRRGNKRRAGSPIHARCRCVAAHGDNVSPGKHGRDRQRKLAPRQECAVAEARSCSAGARFSQDAATPSAGPAGTRDAGAGGPQCCSTARMERCADSVASDACLYELRASKSSTISISRIAGIKEWEGEDFLFTVESFRKVSRATTSKRQARGEAPADKI